mmetsp:Transcript_100824/g.256518  ORF Transcript_100824/g.256518 Transcript_100824/m.256518 type:complete len:244 (-) Transcript_100824:34-765(-)
MSFFRVDSASSFVAAILAFFTRPGCATFSSSFQSSSLPNSSLQPSSFQASSSRLFSTAAFRCCVSFRCVSFRFCLNCCLNFALASVMSWRKFSEAASSSGSFSVSDLPGASPMRSHSKAAEPSRSQTRDRGSNFESQYSVRGPERPQMIQLVFSSKRTKPRVEMTFPVGLVVLITTVLSASTSTSYVEPFVSFHFPRKDFKLYSTSFASSSPSSSSSSSRGQVHARIRVHVRANPRHVAQSSL